MKGEQYMKKTLLYSGKAKDIFSTEDEDLIVSVYKDQATMLNGARKETIEGKGSLANQISSLIFEKLNAAGVATHFVKRLSDREQLNKKVEVVLSDMAPNTSGFSAVDQPRMIYLCELAMDFAEQVLPEGGTLVIKVFQGEGSDALRKNMQQRFSKVRSIKPAASRARSKEMYWIATK